MRTKPGVDSLSFDDLYNNLRVFENDVKGSTASSSSTQNVAFVSENTSSTNDVSTAYGVSNPSGQNSQYEHASSYSLLANQSSCPQLDHEDLEQLDEFDLEEMDLKWQVAMISMRMKKFYKKTGRKLQFDAKEPVGFDKTKVECYNCHKTGHFARECRTKGNQDSKRRDAWNSGNKDGRRSGKQEDSKALVTIDGEGVDWTSHSEEEEDFALMACNSSGSDTEVQSCSNECVASYNKLKKLYDEQRAQLSDASIEIKAYTQALKKVEAQLVAHQQGQLWYEEKIRFMKIDLDDKTDVLTYHKKLLAEAEKEKEDLKAKVEKWHNSSKNLSLLKNSQMSANDKFGLGYGDHRYDGILSYENEVLQSVFMNKESDLENQPLYNRFVTAEGMHTYKGEYDIWAMKMEHYLAYTDYPIWEVIQNGNGPVLITTDTQGQIKVLPPRTAEEILAKERERKVRMTLLMALPEDHLAKFHKMTDAKEMWDAIKSRFGGNDESKKMFQSLLSQLEIHGAGVSTEDANQKFLRSLPSAWSQVSLIMRTKPGVANLSFDDLYNNLRVFENDVKGSTASSSSTQNSLYEHASSYSLLANQSSCPQLDHEDLEQLDEFDLEEMDLKWQVAMISIRMKEFYKKTSRKLQFDAKEPIGFDKTKVECYNCHKTWHFARECRTKVNQDSKRIDAWNSGNKDGRRSGKQEDSKALVTIDGEGVVWTSHSEEEEDFALIACNSSGSDTMVQSCSNECVASYNKLKKLCDEQRAQFSDASIEIKAYTQALKKVEAQLVAHQQGQLWYEEKIRFMKIDLDDKTDVLTYHKKLLAEAEKEKEDLKAKVEKWHNSSKNLSLLQNSQMSANDKFGLGYGDHRYDGILSYENEVLQSVFMNKESDLENQPLYNRFVTAEGMHAVPPPMTGNYMPSRPDIEIDYSQFTYGPKQTQTSESETQTSDFDTCESDCSVETHESLPKPAVNEPKVVNQPKVWSDAPIIDEETVKNQFIHSKNPKVDKKGLRYGFTTKACFVCGSLSHLIRDCDFYEKRMAQQAELNNRMRKKSSQREIRLIWNNVQRVNHKNQFVPTAVQTRTGKIPVSTARASGTNNVSTTRHNFNSQAVLTNAARKISTVKPFVNRVRPETIFHKTHSPFRRPFNNTSLRTNFSKQKVNTAEVNAASAVGGKRETAVKPSAGCNWRPKRHYWHKISKHNGGSRPRYYATFKDPLGRLKPKQAWAPKRI
ncbi:ribonuclease H-like domain-containing protein [Tanacetum coccineum]